MTPKEVAFLNLQLSQGSAATQSRWGGSPYCCI